jgi:cytochrome c oxidase subunit 2
MRAEKVELEIVGSQFKWEVRYPGLDGQLGSHQFEALSSENTSGINLSDERGYDDFQVTKIVLPKGKPVHFKIRAKDVIHSVFAPHFRSKMDAVPGMPTRFWFVPKKTTLEMREELQDPDFNYELACAEVCGKGHFSMRMLVKVEDNFTYEK